MAAKVKLRWEGADGTQSGWRIYRSPRNANTWVHIGDAPAAATTYLDKTVISQAIYDYDVVKLDAAGAEVSHNRFGPIRTHKEMTGGTPLPRFGPTGQYWAPSTPKYDGSDSLHDITLTECTGAAIKTAIAGLTATQVSEGVRILVPAGRLGAGSTKTAPTVGNVGDPLWNNNTGFKRVLVRPAGARDSVILDYDVVFVQVNSVIWAGFANAESMEIYGGVNTGFARILLTDTASWKVHSNGATMTGLYCGEIVRRGLKISNGDPSGFATTSDSDIVGAIMEGHYMSPNYKVDTGHTDTWQADGRNGFYTRDLTIRNCVYFGSNNAAIQCGGVLGLNFENTYLCGSGYQSRYGWPFEYVHGKSGNSINGKASSRDHAMNFTDCVILGTISSANTSTHPIRTVTRSYCSYQPSNITTGSFVVDPEFHDTTYPDAPGVPDDEYLAVIWDGATPLNLIRRDATNTGIAGVGLTEANLTAYSGPTRITTAGTRIYRQIVPKIWIEADNVVFEECIIRVPEGTNGDAYVVNHTGYPKGTRFVDCTLAGNGVGGVDVSPYPNGTAPSAMFEPGLSYEAIRCNISGCTDVVKPHASGILIEDSYLHRPVKWYTKAGAGKHSDTTQISSSAKDITIRRSTLDGLRTNEAGERRHASSMLQIGGFSTTTSNLTNIIYEDNYINGQGYVLTQDKLAQAATCVNCHVRNNRIGLASRHGMVNGPSATAQDGGSFKFTGNVWAESGTTDSGLIVTAGDPV